MTDLAALRRRYEIVRDQIRDGQVFGHVPDNYAIEALRVAEEALALLASAAATPEPPSYDPTFGDDRSCPGCGHEYYRHFDTYDGMRPIGCKYCSCKIWGSAPLSGLAT